MIRHGTLPHLALLLAGLLPVAACVASRPGAAGSTASAEEVGRVEQEIRDLTERFNRSYERNDMNAYWGFYENGMTQLWDSGRVTLDQYKKDWTALLATGGGVREIKIEDLHVRVSPAADAAVASYRIFVRLGETDGKESTAWYHESDFWFRGDGNWKVNFLHYSRVGPSPLT